MIFTSYLLSSCVLEEWCFTWSGREISGGKFLRSSWAWLFVEKPRQFVKRILEFRCVFLLAYGETTSASGLCLHFLFLLVLDDPWSQAAWVFDDSSPGLLRMFDFLSLYIFRIYSHVKFSSFVCCNQNYLRNLFIKLSAKFISCHIVCCLVTLVSTEYLLCGPSKLSGTWWTGTQ